MTRKISFPELQCSQCEYHQTMGHGLLETRYCGGFPKRKKPKRFSKSDPKFKAPKWCPRRVWPPVCRIYSFANEQCQELDILTRNRFDPKHDQYISAFESRYKLRLETTLPMKAKEFLEAVEYGDAADFMIETDLQPGDVIEIDDGLKPYCFYCWSWARVIPIYRFDRTLVKKEN